MTNSRVLSIFPAPTFRKCFQIRDAAINLQHHFSSRSRFILLDTPADSF